jgi:ribosomal protein L17
MVSQLVKHERIETTLAKVLSFACQRFFNHGLVVVARAGFLFEEG